MRVRAADEEKIRSGRVSELFVYDNFSRVPVDQAEAGDICALTGLSDVAIGETICAREAPNPLPTIKACPHEPEIGLANANHGNPIAPSFVSIRRT